MTDVYWYYQTKNQSPRVTEAFLAKQRRLLLPGQFRREHENSWTDAADSFVTAADVDWAMAQYALHPARATEGVGYMHAVDLGAVHDPTVIGCGYVNAQGQIAVHRVETFQGSKAAPVLVAVIEAALQRLAQTFPPLRIRIESWQGLGTVQKLAALNLPVEIFTPTAKTNAEEWPILARHLAERTIILPPHERLREELVSLTYEVGATGIRVIDKGRIHQDHAVVVRMLAAMLSPFTESVALPSTQTYDVLKQEGCIALARELDIGFAIEDHPDFVRPDYEDW
jgi:hypothetical protein